MTTLTEQERQYNRNLYDFAWRTLCNNCRNIIGYRSSPNEWERCKEKGKCGVCLNMKRMRYGGTRDESWPSVEAIDYPERDSIHPLQYE